MTTYTLKAEDVTPQSIRALHQHITGRGPEELREFLTWISEGLRYGHDLTLTVGEPDADTEPWCNHDPAALTDVIVLRCECGATVDPDTGDVIGAGETGPDAVALGLVPEPECQRCADHDPRDRRDHGHIPDSLSHPERP